MLEACKMFPSFIRIAQTLQGARKPKFSRGMKRIQFERVLEGGHCFFILSQLRLRQADEIKYIRIIWGTPGGGLEGGQGLFKVSLVLVHQSQRVPDMCVVGILPG